MGVHRDHLHGAQLPSLLGLHAVADDRLRERGPASASLRHALARATSGDKTSPAVGIGCCALVILLLMIKMAMDRPAVILNHWY